MEDQAEYDHGGPVMGADTFISKDMQALIERIHENADHLCELLDEGFWTMGRPRLKSMGFLLSLMKEDAALLHALHGAALKNQM